MYLVSAHLFWPLCRSARVAVGCELRLSAIICSGPSTHRACSLKRHSRLNLSHLVHLDVESNRLQRILSLRHARQATLSGPADLAAAAAAAASPPATTLIAEDVEAAGNSAGALGSIACPLSCIPSFCRSGCCGFQYAAMAGMVLAVIKPCSQFQRVQKARAGAFAAFPALIDRPRA